MKRILAFVLLLCMLLSMTPASAYADGAWKKNGSGWWYQNADGSYPAARWQKIDGKWYYFNVSGYMQTGWQEINGTWYYLSSSGAMQTGWVKSGKSWYYLDGSGAMRTGWEKSSGKWYYLNASGAMQTGWLKLKDEWYYLDSSGAMKTGWQKIGGKWYYFRASGEMRTGWHYVDETWYNLFYNGGYTKSSQPPADYRYTDENYRELYQSVLDQYVQYYELLAEHGSEEIRWADYGVSECCNYAESPGYIIQDLDGNGIKELMIGNKDTNEELFYQMVFCLYTIDNGVAYQVFGTGLRSRMHYLDTGLFLNQGSNGAAYSVEVLFKYENGIMAAIDGIWSSDNYLQGQPVYWYRTPEYMDFFPENLRISEEEAFTLRAEWESRVVTPEYLPLLS